MVQVAEDTRSMDTKPRTCYMCGEKKLCHVWWDDWTDGPVWLCKNDMLRVQRRKLQENKEKELWQQLKEIQN